MTQTDAPTVDNGVDIEAMRGAKAALTDAPEAAKFQWRAQHEWVQGYAQPLHDHRFLRARTAARAPAGLLGRSRPPPGVRVRGQRRDPAGDRPRRARLVPDRGNRDGRDAPGSAAPLGDRNRGRRHGPAGHPRHRRRRAQWLQRDQRHVRHRRRCVTRGHRGDRGAVAEALGRLRHRDQPVDRARRALA